MMYNRWVVRVAWSMCVGEMKMKVYIIMQCYPLFGWFAKCV